MMNEDAIPGAVERRTLRQEVDEDLRRCREALLKEQPWRLPSADALVKKSRDLLGLSQGYSACVQASAMLMHAAEMLRLAGK